MNFKDMKNSLIILLFFTSWFAPMILCAPSFALAWGLLYGISFIVFLIIMMTKEKEMEERRFKEECMRDRIIYERERRRRQAYFDKQGYIIKL